MTGPATRELQGRRSLWRIEEPMPADLRGSMGDISPMLAHLLFCRDYRSAADIDGFFTAGPTRHDPWLLPDMPAAVERIAHAVETGERVAIYGDFDCDGLTATAVLEGALRDLGLDPLVYIPHRDDGHGLQPEPLTELHGDGATLVITGDCGIVAVDEVQVARGLGIDVIVTDHHEPHADGSLPRCPVVAPTRHDSDYPCRFLCGVGVAFKLTEALAQRLPGRIDPRQYLDLVALGTVADVVPLRDENRSLVMLGLTALQQTVRPGLRALFDAAGVDAASIDPVSIGFYLAPRINAANRMASPQLAYDLLSTRDAGRAHDLAVQLGKHNEERQRLVEHHVNSLLRQLGPAPTVAAEVRTGERPPILVVRGDWPAGVSGLLATRLVETYGVPAFAGSASGSDTIAVSGRGIPGVHLDEMLEQAEGSVSGGLFVGHGGHSAAGGFRVHAARWDEAVAALETVARTHVRVELMGSVMRVDADIPLNRVTLDAAEKVRSLAPFGTGFAEPLFLSRRLTVRSCAPMSGGRHARLVLQQGATRQTAVCFGAEPDMLRLVPGSCIDAIYHLTLNEWNGSRRPQMQIRDWRLAD